MRAETAVHTILGAASAVTSLLGTPPAGSTVSIYPGQAPQNAVPPVLVVEHVSGQELTTIDANSTFALCRARISVTAIAKSYVAVKNLLEQVRLALNYQRGTFNSVRVVSIIRDTVGPDQRDDDLQLFSQSIDFQVVYQEP